MSKQRLARAAIAMCLVGLPGLCPHRSLAQETGIVLVTSGDWVATEQRDSPTAPAYMCSAYTRKSGRIFELQANIVDTEVRFTEAGWSNPEDVPGTLGLAVGAFRTTLNVTDDTDNVATTAIAMEQLHAMIAAMEKANAMTIAVGSAPTQTVSLRGSNRATDAFRACSSQLRAANTGGTNSFQ